MTSGQTAPITAADESYGHQDVAPAAVTAHADPAWAERCWHIVHLGDGWLLGAGRALHRHAGQRTAKAGLNTGFVQFARRTRDDFAEQDDPDRPDVGAIRIETLRPLHEVRLILDEPGCPFGFDLTYHARFPAVASGRNRIERAGVVVTDYMHFFQSGLYSGVVWADGEQRRYDQRMGFRDRGWGLRKHEGAARRGMHIFCGCELPDEAIYMLLYENARGERMFTNGWVMDRSGLADTVVGIEHELQMDGRLATSGRFEVLLQSGRRRSLAFEVDGRLWMETIGYTAVPGRADPGSDRFDLRDAAVFRSLLGLIDNGARFTADGVSGNGYVELGLGIHAGYRPADEP